MHPVAVRRRRRCGGGAATTTARVARGDTARVARGVRDPRTKLVWYLGRSRVIHVKLSSSCRISCRIPLIYLTRNVKRRM